MRSRLAREPTMLARTAMAPKSLRRASASTASQRTPRPSRNESPPKSSSPVCSTASAVTSSARTGGEGIKRSGHASRSSMLTPGGPATRPFAAGTMRDRAPGHARAPRPPTRPTRPRPGSGDRRRALRSPGSRRRRRRPGPTGRWSRPRTWRSGRRRRGPRSPGPGPRSSTSSRPPLPAGPGEPGGRRDSFMHMHYEAIRDDDASIAAALEDVSIPTLLVAMVHLTGDPSWIRDEKLKPQGLFLNEVQGFMSEEARAEARRRAVDAIKAYRDGGCVLPPPPTDELVHEMMSFLACEEVPDDYVPLMLEELELDGVDARRIDIGADD